MALSPKQLTHLEKRIREIANEKKAEYEYEPHDESRQSSKHRLYRLGQRDFQNHNGDGWPVGLWKKYKTYMVLKKTLDQKRDEIVEQAKKLQPQSPRSMKHEEIDNAAAKAYEQLLFADADEALKALEAFRLKEF